MRTYPHTGRCHVSRGDDRPSVRSRCRLRSVRRLPAHNCSQHLGRSHGCVVAALTLPARSTCHLGERSCGNPVSSIDTSSCKRRHLGDPSWCVWQPAAGACDRHQRYQGTGRSAHHCSDRAFADLPPWREGFVPGAPQKPVCQCGKHGLRPTGDRQAALHGDRSRAGAVAIRSCGPGRLLVIARFQSVGEDREQHSVKERPEQMGEWPFS
jgi:hypothetical protein